MIATAPCVRAAKFPSRAIADANGKLYLHPGEFAVAGVPCTITTILGSCVSVCLYDPVTRLGGLNHFLLPTAPAHDQSPRYGDVALQQLVAMLESHGVQRNRLTATVIGGACVLDAYHGVRGHIGSQNVRAALRVLQQQRIAVSTTLVGGARARKLRFRPDTGYLLVNTL
jgi:chemotaxis protein CheD